MKFIDWMREEGLDDQQVADRLNALPSSDKSISSSAVKKWKYDERIPRPDEMVGIHEISGGKVEPNDFYGVGSTAPARAEP